MQLKHYNLTVYQKQKGLYWYESNKQFNKKTST
jgi:hypothetical protein